MKRVFALILTTLYFTFLSASIFENFQLWNAEDTVCLQSAPCVDEQKAGDQLQLNKFFFHHRHLVSVVKVKLYRYSSFLVKKIVSAHRHTTLATLQQEGLLKCLKVPLIISNCVLRI